MIRSIVSTIMQSLLTLLIIVTLTFILLKAIPGDPFTQEQAIPKEIHQTLLNHYGLSQPFYDQYGKYLFNIFHGDLGPSLVYKGQTVNGIIRDGFPVSAVLGIEAIIISLIAGVSFGTIAAVKQNQNLDTMASVIAVIGVSLPSFLLAMFLQYIFAYKMGLFPIARWGTFTQSILPALSLAALPTAYLTRLVRANMIQTLSENYIKTARMKGLSEFRVITRHALSNAILPLLPYLGQITASIITGSFVVEKIFAIPGLGHWLITSVNNRDYPVVLGITLYCSLILIIVMSCLDIAYSLVDPRIRKESS